MPYLLLADASINGVAMALADLNQRRMIWQKADPRANAGSAALGKDLQMALRAGGINAADLSGVCVGCGPGSFTGIKICLAFCYGLKWRKGMMPLKFLGVSSVEIAVKMWTDLLPPTTKGNLRVILPVTKTHAFVSQMGEAGAETSLQSVGEVSYNLNSNPDLKGQLLKPWPALQEKVQPPSDKLNTVRDLQATQTEILNGMLEHAKAHWETGKFSTALPQARYMRLTTAEEKMQVQGGVHGGC